MDARRLIRSEGIHQERLDWPLPELPQPTIEKSAARQRLHHSLDDSPKASRHTAIENQQADLALRQGLLAQLLTLPCVRGAWLRPCREIRRVGRLNVGLKAIALLQEEACG